MKVSLLFSYAYIRKIPALALFSQRCMETNACDVIIDSGGFSVHRIGEKIDLGEYCAYCNSIAHLPGLWGCVQLDVVGNKEGTLANLEESVTKFGSRPMPVMTIDMKDELALELRKVNRRIAAAGALGEFTGHMEWVCNRYRSILKQIPDAQVHGLGFVRHPFMYQCGLTTVDSSSSSSGERYGTIMIYDNARGMRSLGRWQEQRVMDFNKHDKLYKELLACCGISSKEFSDEALMRRGHASWAACSTTYACIQQSRSARRYGLNLHLALGTPSICYRMVAIMATERPDRRGFDFLKARSIFHKWHKGNQTDSMEECSNVFSHFNR